MSSQTLVFFGIIGSGKGTQVERLMGFLKDKDGKECVWISPGNEYRKLIESGSHTGTLVKDSVSAGNLQPDFLTNSIVTNILSSSLSDDKHLLMDGYPRTVAQSETFFKMMEFFKREDIKIIYIEISEEEAKRRNLLRGRHDDTEEGIIRRIEEYKNNVIPAMDYFKDKDGYEILKINGEQTRDEVFQDIKSALGF